MQYLKRRLAALAFVALAALAVPASAAATSTPEQISASIVKGLPYMEGTQAENGSFPGFGGDWSLTSFAAAGKAAADLHYKGESKRPDARSFYAGSTEYGSPTWPGVAGAAVTEFERAALVSYAAGIDPARVSNRQNLLAQIVARYQVASPGYFGSTFNGTVFAVLALTGAKSQAAAQRFPQSLLNLSVAAIDANQHTDGGWTWEKAAGNETALGRPSEPDLTGAAMAALCGAGVANTNTTIVKAKNYLVGLLETSTGAFGSEFGANTDSNSWAVQGLNACGISPQGTEFTTAAGKTPIDFLISQQLTSGAFRYLPSETGADQYSSQDAVRALAGAGFTAAPPTPKAGEKWLAASSFALGETETDPLSLVIEYAGTLKVCSVAVAPKAATTTLALVLEKAIGGTVPSGCVSSLQPTTGTGAITQINGNPEPKVAGWKVSIDGAAAVQAKRSTSIHVGDTIYLKYE
jgi:hypothetical protein